jgi:hypothetical protein
MAAGGPSMEITALPAASWPVTTRFIGRCICASLVVGRRKYRGCGSEVKRP